MACFLVPTAEAAVVTVVTKIVEKKELKKVHVDGSVDEVVKDETEKIPFSRKLKWLTNLQWGGSLLLAFEHVWHGEVVPWFPFLSAMSDPADAAEMFHEMSTVGVTMALLTTTVWAGMLVVANVIEKRKVSDTESVTE
ncbi:MAG: hypothetical protein J6S95_07630 [Lachnospiraceae bacterium]|nr:hypothetical protein [Lachnospiraceae bacterium]MBO7601002.1 hypothetical protein [Lachnospiraceae bacterium]